MKKLEDQVRDYHRKGGVGRFDRLIAARPRVSAILVAVLLTSVSGAGVANAALRDPDGWMFPVIVASMLLLGGVVLYLIWHRIAVATADAIREYEKRRSAATSAE